MLQKRLISRACWWCARTDRWRAQIIRNLLTLLGILGISLLTAAGVMAGRTMSFQEKGNHPIQQAALVPAKNLPPLDTSQPAKVETFTFGLG